VPDNCCSKFVSDGLPPLVRLLTAHPNYWPFEAEGICPALVCSARTSVRGSLDIGQSGGPRLRPAADNGRCVPAFDGRPAQVFASRGAQVGGGEATAAP